MAHEYVRGTYVDPNIPSHEYIFRNRFKCAINQMDLTSTTYLKKFGTAYTGDAGIDREMANQLITTYKTIAEMVDLFREGVQVRVPIMEDCKKIYEFVDYHVQSWADVVKRSLNLGSAPLDDLIELDKFATKLYPYVLKERTIMENSSVFVSHLGGNYISYDNVLGSFKTPEQIAADKEIKTENGIPERVGFAEVFVEKSKSWK